jgi:hypothetical protein
MSELNIRVDDMEETVHQHVESTRDLQQMSGERLHTIELAHRSSWKSRGPTTGGWDSLLHSSEPEASLGEDPHSKVTCTFIFRISNAKNP